MSFNKIHHLIKINISDFHHIFPCPFNNKHFRNPYLTQYSPGSSPTGIRAFSCSLLSGFFFPLPPQSILYPLWFLTLSPFNPQQFEELPRNIPISLFMFNSYFFFSYLCTFLHSIIGELYYDTRKNVKKQVKNRRKTVIFGSEKCGKRGSVGNLYFNSNGGMRVGGVGFRRSIFGLYIVEKRI